MKVTFGWVGKNAALAIGFLTLLAGFSGAAMAQLAPTPELDPGSMANALLVVSGALFIVTGRRPRK
jgi:hypothetical protein